jgi:hypothetical protein
MKSKKFTIKTIGTTTEYTSRQKFAKALQKLPLNGYVSVDVLLRRGIFKKKELNKLKEIGVFIPVVIKEREYYREDSIQSVVQYLIDNKIGKSAEIIKESQLSLFS